VGGIGKGGRGKTWLARILRPETGREFRMKKRLGLRNDLG
jgi:hypothetical protein